MKILLVDDHILFREGLVSLFKTRPGFNVVGEAGSVSQAIEKADQLKPDLILMDFTLPDGTGLEATRAILAKQPNCKIVFLTVHVAEEKLFAAVRLGAKGYMLKDVPISKLLASLDALDRGEPAMSRVMAGHIIEAFSRIENPQMMRAEALDKLTLREYEILKVLSDGATNQEIAHRLFISENTVKHHIHSILSKLELNDRREAANLVKKYDRQMKPPSSDADSSG